MFLILVEEFVSTFTVILPYLYLIYDPTYVTALMNWFFFSSFLPMLNEVPNEKVFNESILWSSATLQDLGDCECSWFILGLELQTVPNSMVPFAALSQDRSVWLSKGYREEVLSQQVVFFFLLCVLPVGGWWAGLAHSHKAAENWSRNINWKLTLSPDWYHKCHACLY